MSINRLLLIIAGAALAAAAALAVPAWRHAHETPPPPPSALRLAFVPSPTDAGQETEDISIGAGPDHPFGLALAPDGRRIAFPAAQRGTAQLWVRDLTTGSLAALPGTANGVLPFWSRDGRQLGFFAGGRLKSLVVESGQLLDLAEAPAPRGAAFDAAGNVIFAPRNDGGLMRRRADDGVVEPLTPLDTASGETSHRFPSVLDDDRHLLFFVRAAEPQRSGIWIARLDHPQTRARVTGSTAHGLASGEWVIFGRDDALLAQHFAASDDGLPSLDGRPVLLGKAVGQSPLNQLSASVAADAIIFGSPQPRLRDLKWIDRRDGTMSTMATAIDAWDVRVAPNAGRVAVTSRDPQIGTLDVQIFEGGRPLARRISQGIDVDDSVVWAPDGSRVAWVQAQRAIAVRGAQAQLPELTVRKFDVPIRLWDWSRDAQRFVIGFTRPATRDDLFVMAADGTSEPVAYAQSAFNETYAAISPDGKWIAYASDESGQPEIYVDSFPVAGHRARLSAGGGSEPRWHLLGEVFFKRGSEVHLVNVSFDAEVPEATAATRLFDAGGDIRSFDVTADGQRFLVNVPSPRLETEPITVVVNWRSLLGSTTPGGRR
jgi:eukaryotic-like serine/threonine-protein kinase